MNRSTLSLEQRKSGACGELSLFSFEEEEIGGCREQQRRRSDGVGMGVAEKTMKKEAYGREENLNGVGGSA